MVLGGDKNNLNISTLLTGIPRLRNIVTKPTHRNKILDVILTNLHALYDIPIITPPDKPLQVFIIRFYYHRHCHNILTNVQGVPSDHSVPIATPLAMSSASTPREYVTRWYRPLPESGINEFGQWVCSEDLQDEKGDLNPTEQVGLFEKIVKQKLDVILPRKISKS